MERIYIGGLDPPRLTAEQVASRLESIPGVDIRSTDLVGNDKQFFYVNAVSKDDSDMSALNKIAKQYNNITWKRCRLVVQAARPHLLERLAQERMQCANASEQEGMQQETKEPKAIPRYLRIRQKFGEEAHQVDTKPFRTSEWSDFCRVVSKLRTRREQHSEVMRHRKHEQRNETLEAKKKAFRNRAVHLRWNENLNGNRSEPSLVDIMSDASAHDESESTSTTTGQSESDSNDSSESKTHQLKNGRHSAYVWSDDDESDESSDEGGAYGIEARADRVSDADESDTSDSESEALEEEEAMVASRAKDKDPVKQSSARYEWSSDDNNEVDADPPERRTSSLKPESSTVATEEFSACIDFSDSSSDNDSDGGGSDSNERMDIPQDLDNDVKANLGILSSLFPDMAETKPVAVDAGSDVGEGQGKARSETMQPGWEMGPSGSTTSMAAGLGLMQRFDPTKESAKKYILEPTKPYIENEPAGETSDDRRPDSSSEMDEDGQPENAESSSDESESAVVAAESVEGDEKTTVYEQSKLEGIFREARSSSGTDSFKMSSLFDSKNPDGEHAGHDKAFAFGFDVGTDTTTTKQPANESGAFAFSFVVNNKELQNSGRLGENETDAVSLSGRNGTMSDTRAEKSDVQQKQAGDSSAGIERRGLFFPEASLDEYATAFFAMNEGSRIRQDPQGFLLDEGVKQQWKKKRQALTLDWKRKRKYAQSRMQKKMKFR